MENELTSQVQTEASPLLLNNKITESLMSTAKWAKFLAIMGFIGCGLMAIGGFFASVAFSAMGRHSYSPVPPWVFSFIYLAMAVLYFFPTLKLFLFSNEMKNGIESNEENSITSGFKNLKSFFSLLGIYTIVIISLYILLIIISIFAALLMR